MEDAEKLTVPAPALLLDRISVGRLLNMTDCISAVERAFAAHARGQLLSPHLIHIVADAGEFHVKAGGIQGERTYMSCKVGGGFFGNRKRLGLPNIIGLILLCDGTNGVPLAVIESGLITRLRTAAATAVAAKYLARRDSHTITVCGAGAQAEMHLHALAEVLPLERAFVWSRRDCAVFAERVTQALKFEVRAISDLQSATLQSDVIVTCTPAHRWIVGRRHVRAGTFLAAIGADSPGKQEIEPELLVESSVVCDLVAQATNVGDLQHVIKAGLMGASQVRGELGAVIIGDAPKRLRDDEIIVFDSTGTAFEDTAAAALVFERAVEAGYNQRFAFWG